MIRFGLILSLALLFASCSETAYGPFSYSSPEKTRTVVIKGSRKVALDPVKVEVKVTVPKGDKTFFLELNAGSLSEENLTVEWESNDKGKIVFTQTDGSQKVLNMDLRDDRIHVLQDLPQGL